MSLERREQLVRLAREHDALIVADDVYGMCFRRRYSVTPTEYIDQTSCNGQRVLQQRTCRLTKLFCLGLSMSIGTSMVVQNGKVLMDSATQCRTVASRKSLAPVLELVGVRVPRN